MNFEQFVSVIDKPAGKAFEQSLAAAAINGDWSLVRQSLHGLTDDMPDSALASALVSVADGERISIESWPIIQSAILRERPTHIVFRMDGNAVYDVLQGEGDGPGTDHPVGLDVGFGRSGTVADPLDHARTLAAQAATRGWSVSAEGNPSVASIRGLGDVLGAMRRALFVDEGRIDPQVHQAMFRISGWWIGLALNRAMARFASQHALTPVIPVFVSSKLGGGAILGWHIPAGETPVPCSQSSTTSTRPSEPEPLSFVTMAPRVERLIRYKMAREGYEPSADEHAFISFRYFYGRDPESWFERCRERPMTTRQPPEPLSPEEAAWLAAYVQQRRSTQLANEAEREETERRKATMFAKAAESGAVQARISQREAENEAEHRRRQSSKDAQQQREAEMGATYDDIASMLDGWTSEKGNAAGKQIAKAQRLANAFLDIMRRP